MPSVIEGFLVRLGFEVDADSERRFNEALRRAREKQKLTQEEKAALKEFIQLTKEESAARDAAEKKARQAAKDKQNEINAANKELSQIAKAQAAARKEAEREAEKISANEAKAAEREAKAKAAAAREAERQEDRLAAKKRQERLDNARLERQERLDSERLQRQERLDAERLERQRIADERRNQADIEKDVRQKEAEKRRILKDNAREAERLADKKVKDDRAAALFTIQQTLQQSRADAAAQKEADRRQAFADDQRRKAVADQIRDQKELDRQEKVKFDRERILKKDQQAEEDRKKKAEEKEKREAERKQKLADQAEKKAIDDKIHARGRLIGSIRKVGLATIAAATGAAYAFMRNTKALSDLYNFSYQQNTNPESIKTLGQAFLGVGGSVEDAKAAVAGIATALKTLPQADLFIKSNTGVDIRDANGKLKDTARILMEIREAFKGMDQGYARGVAEALGIGGQFDTLMRGDLAEALDRAAESMRGWNDSLSEAAPGASRLQKEISLLMDNISNGLLVATGKLAEQTGLNDWLETINTKAPDWFSNQVDAEVLLQKDSTGFWDWLYKSVVNREEYVDKARSINEKKRIDKSQKQEPKALPAPEPAQTQKRQVTQPETLPAPEPAKDFDPYEGLFRLSEWSAPEALPPTQAAAPLAYVSPIEVKPVIPPPAFNPVIAMREADRVAGTVTNNNSTSTRTMTVNSHITINGSADAQEVSRAVEGSFGKTFAHLSINDLW